jgi:hypothetical protein
VDTLADLQVGDYVVHASYGIGKFLGIKTIQEKGGTSEYLTIEYADGAKIQVSARNIALVQKFIGTSPKRPKLSKVGLRFRRSVKQKAGLRSGPTRAGRPNSKSRFLIKKHRTRPPLQNKSRQICKNLWRWTGCCAVT